MDRLPPSRIQYDFPPQDLLSHLINVYFSTVAIYFPFIHRGLFEKQVTSGLHQTDDRFAVIVLLVCAVASRNSYDPRVLLYPDQPHSAGWAYYEQVEPVITSTPPTIPDLLDLQSALVRKKL
jgi:hypothetical protein